MRAPMERRPSYLAAFGWTVAGVTGAVLSAIVVDRLAVPPAEFTASAAAAAVLALLFARRPAEGVGAFLLFLLFADNWEYWLGVDLRLADEGTVVLFGAVGLVRRYLPGRPLRFGLKEAALAVVLATGVTSSLANEVPITVWGPATILLFKAIVFFYLISWLTLTVEDVERVGLVIGSAVLVIAGLGFVEYLDPPRFQQLFGLPSLVQDRGISVTRSIFLHPSMYGWLTVSASLFLYARFIVMRSWWSLPVALLLNTGTVLSTRRTPLIGLAAALVTGLIWRMRKWSLARAIAMVWGPLAVIALVFTLIFFPVLERAFEFTMEEYRSPPGVIAEILSPDPDANVIATAQPRVALYVGSVAIGRDHFPLGAGLGRYGSHMSRVEYSPLYGQYGLDQVPGLQPADGSAVTDTFWPMLLGETGVVGMIAFAAFIAVLLVELWHTAGRAEALRSRAFGLGVLMLYVGALVGSATSATYVAPPTAYFLFAAVGASLAVSERRS